MFQLGFNVNANVKRRLKVCVSISAILFTVMNISPYFMYDVFSSESKFFFVVAYIVSNSYMTLFFMEFCLVLHAVYRRFEVINECIRWVIECKKSFPKAFASRSNFKTEEEDATIVFDKKLSRPEHLITKLSDLHDSLNDVVTDVNRCFAFEVRFEFSRLSVN